MIRKIAAFAALALVISLAIVGAPPKAYAAGTGVVQGVVTVPAGASPTSVVVTLATGATQVAITTADASGAYQLTSIPDGTYILAFNYQGTQPVLSEYAGGSYRRETAKPIVVSNGATVTEDATLERGAVLTVLLQDPAGDPITSELTTASLQTTGASYEDNPLNGVSMNRIGSGPWFSTALVPGTYHLTVGGSEWLPASLDLIVGPGSDSGSTIVMAPGSDRQVVLTLSVKGKVVGNVSLAGPGGTVPWSGVVQIVDATTLGVRTTSATNPDGSFEIAGIDDGTYKVRFYGTVSTTALSYWPGTWDASAAPSIAISAGQVKDLGSTTLQLGGYLRGDVFVQPPGSGMIPAAATVQLWKLDSSNGSYAFYREGQTDANGRFDTGVVDSGTYAIWARPTDVNSDLGAVWHTNARYFADRVDVVVAPGATVKFNDMVLEPRYFDTWRTAGPDRFATAVEISHELFPVQDGQRPRPAVVYLVNAYNYPDALAAGPTAIRQGGAILPVARDFAPETILAELADLNPARIVVAGGVNAVADAVLDEVRSRVPGAAVVRIGEATRYETARAIVQDAFGEAGSGVAFIATGRNYPDALAAGAAAGYLDGPVILVDGLSAGLDAGTTQLLTGLGVHDVYIAGGGAVVGAGVESALVGLLGADHVHRLAGNDRFETAAAINTEVFGDHFEIGFIASGYSFPDALAGGPLAAAHQAPLYLSPQECMPDPTFFGLWDGQAQGFWLLGGESVLGPEVEQLAEC